MSDFLFLLRYFETPDILFQFSFINAVFVLNVLQSYLGVFFELGELVLVLEHEVLESLLVDFYFDFVFFI